jgi:hypothetical protein
MLQGSVTDLISSAWCLSAADRFSLSTARDIDTAPAHPLDLGAQQNGEAEEQES